MAATLMTEAMVTAALEATASKTKPKDADPFRKGDCVVYPAHGVGRIDRVGVEEIAGHRLNLIHISFDENRMTLRVPVAGARAAGLRKLGSQKQLAEALASLRGRPRPSRLMWSKRAQEYLAKSTPANLGRWPRWFATCRLPTVRAAALVSAICSSLHSTVLLPNSLLLIEPPRWKRSRS